MPLVFLRFFLLIALLVIIGAVVAALVFNDKRWFRFAWQVFKFSMITALVVAAAIVTGRLILLL